MEAGRQRKALEKIGPVVSGVALTYRVAGAKGFSLDSEQVEKLKSGFTTYLAQKEAVINGVVAIKIVKAAEDAQLGFFGRLIKAVKTLFGVNKEEADKKAVDELKSLKVSAASVVPSQLEVTTLVQQSGKVAAEEIASEAASAALKVRFKALQPSAVDRLAAQRADSGDKGKGGGAGR